jgi:hypothetical protein
MAHSGMVSPMVGREVWHVTGIVTYNAVYLFYLQDARLGGDGDDATSDALVVLLLDPFSVAPGDLVSVSGFVSEALPSPEFDSLELTTTQIGRLDDFSNYPPDAIVGDQCVIPAAFPTVTVLSNDNPFPDPVAIGGVGARSAPSQDMADGLSFWESLEAMLVTLVEPITVAPTDDQFFFNYVVANSGMDATGLSSRGTMNIAPDDFNPEKIRVAECYDLVNDVRCNSPFNSTGSVLEDITGVLGYVMCTHSVFRRCRLHVCRCCLSFVIFDVELLLLVDTSPPKVIALIVGRLTDHVLYVCVVLWGHTRYSFGEYEVIPIVGFDVVTSSVLTAAETTLVKSDDHVLVGTYNVRDLDINAADLQRRSGRWTV